MANEVVRHLVDIGVDIHMLRRAGACEEQPVILRTVLPPASRVAMP